MTFGLWADWSVGGLPWVPTGLSTLRPTTSPRLSVIKLNFRSSTGLLVETLIADMGRDLRRIADEVSRIEREFEGAVSVTVFPDSGIEAMLDTLNVRLCFVGWKRPRSHGDLPSPLLQILQNYTH